VYKDFPDPGDAGPEYRAIIPKELIEFSGREPRCAITLFEKLTYYESGVVR
jgi:hypothetical protein